MYRILLIEGHLPDAVLVERALGADADVKLRVVYGAAEALRLLRRQPPYEGLILPDLILLDVDLPEGIAPLMVFLRKDRALRRLPVLLMRSPDPAVATGSLTYTLYTSGDLQRPRAVTTTESLLDALRQPRGLWPLLGIAEA